MRDEWELTPEKYLNAEELSCLLRKAEELYVLGIAKRRKANIRDWIDPRTDLLRDGRHGEADEGGVQDSARSPSFFVYQTPA